MHLHNRRQADARQAAVLDLSNQPFAMCEGIGLGSLADSSHTCSAGHHVGPTSVLPYRHPFSQETVVDDDHSSYCLQAGAADKCSAGVLHHVQKWSVVFHRAQLCKGPHDALSNQEAGERAGGEGRLWHEGQDCTHRAGTGALHGKIPLQFLTTCFHHECNLPVTPAWLQLMLMLMLS